MTDLAVRFEGASEETFYKVLAALTSMKGKGYIEKVKFKEIKHWELWDGKIQFLSREALEIFGNKIRSRRK